MLTNREYADSRYIRMLCVGSSQKNSNTDSQEIAHIII